jgi:hypothetical protein
MAKLLKDPVDEQSKTAGEEEEFASLDVSKIKVEVLPDEAAKAVHPFDGYPIVKIKIPMPETDKSGKKVVVQKEFNLTDWVLHNHQADPIHQDPSNRRNRTFHSRSIMDLPKGNSAPNVMIQFCNKVETGSGTFYGAIVPDPYIRAQLIFKREPKSGRVIVDKRYTLLDRGQAGRLKQCFFNLIKPQLDNEAAADKIMAGEEPAAMREISPGEEL